MIYIGIVFESVYYIILYYKNAYITVMVIVYKIHHWKEN